MSPDKTMKAASKGIKTWMHFYGIPREVRSDDGPSYGKEFSEFCRKNGVNHCLASAYNPQSNGNAEKVVGQIKLLLEKMGRKSVLSQDHFGMLVFKINSHVTAGQGSPLERFFGRNVGTYQMELFRKKIDHAQLIAKRSEV